MLIKMLSIVLLLLSGPILALVPMEGIIMGKAQLDIQHDPLALVFANVYDTSQAGENQKVKDYYRFYKAGEALLEQCSHHAPASYASSWQEKQARRTMVATLQYIGLDQSIKAIGAYARELKLGPEDYKILRENLVRNHCSQNLTVYSVRTVDKALEHYYQNPDPRIIPSVATSPFATEAFKLQTAGPAARSREFDLAIANFRAFCSWGGDVVDYRMLGTYLNNPFLMGAVISNLTGNKNQIQMSCDELICRKVPKETFVKHFPTSIGSTGVGTDLVKLYCHHFRLQDHYPARTIPQIQSWMKAAELEDAVYESSFLISLLTGVPDPIFSIDRFKELPLLVKSPVDERWNKWARDVLSFFSHDLLYEESIKVRMNPRREISDLVNKGYGIDLHVTLGEIDRVMDDMDKIDMSFRLKVSKNHLRQMVMNINNARLNLDQEAIDKQLEEFSKNLEVQLKEKARFFKQPLWTQDFSRLMAEELLNQALLYRGKAFATYKEEMLEIPVRFSFGAFALGYMRYRTGLQGGALRSNQ
jgi:hypothetical protein